jgi:hypothetical protein
MTLPAGLTLITVTDTYTDVSGAPLCGSVAFAPSAPLTDSTGNAVLGQRPVVAVLDDTGSFSLELPCTDNEDLAAPADQTPWTYVVTIDISGSGYTRTPFAASFPSTLGETVELHTVAAAVLTPPTSDSYVSE